MNIPRKAGEKTRDILRRVQGSCRIPKGEKVETIYNLNLEASRDYAKRSQDYAEDLISQAKDISDQATVAVFSPSYLSQFSGIFGTHIKNMPWGDFFAPKGYNNQKGRLFFHATISSLSSTEKKELLLQRLQSKIEQEENNFAQGDHSLAREKMLREGKKEFNVLYKMLTKIKEFDLDIEEINAKRSQYKKG